MEILLYSLCYIFDALIFWIYIDRQKLFTNHSEISRLVCIFLMHVLIASVNIVFESILINLCLFVMVSVIHLKIHYKINLSDIIYHTLVLTSLIVSCNLFAFCLVNFPISDYYFTTSKFQNSLIISLICKILFFIFFYIFILFSSFRRKNHYKSDSTSFLLFLIPISSVLILLTTSTIGKITTLPLNLSHSILINAIILIFADTLIFVAYQTIQKQIANHTKIMLIEKNNKTLQEDYQIIKQQYNDQRILIHDIKNHLLSMQAYITNKEYDKLNSYINNLQSSSTLNYKCRFCSNDMLNVVLSHYMQECKKHNINFYTDIRPDTLQTVSDNDITALFGNLLDNALNASSGITDGYIDLTITGKNDGALTYISLINSCIENPLDCSGSFKKSSSESSFHGIGLISIRNVINYYNGDMRVYFNDAENSIHTIITLWM